MHRGFYVTARAGECILWLAGPYGTLGEAWGARAAPLEALGKHAPQIKIDARGVSYIDAPDGVGLPPGAFNPTLGRYWSDASNRVYCAHGLILYGTQCVECERKAIL